MQQYSTSSNRIFRPSSSLVLPQREIEVPNKWLVVRSERIIPQVKTFVWFLLWDDEYQIEVSNISTSWLFGTISDKKKKLGDLRERLVTPKLLFWSIWGKDLQGGVISEIVRKEKSVHQDRVSLALRFSNILPDTVIDKIQSQKGITSKVERNTLYLRWNTFTVETIRELSKDFSLSLWKVNEKIEAISIEHLENVPLNVLIYLVNAENAWIRLLGVRDYSENLQLVREMLRVKWK